VLTYVTRRDCYLGAWTAMTELEGTCRLGAELDSTAVRVDDPQPEVDESLCVADAEWDAGDMACGDLVLALRRRLSALLPGRLLRLIARDPGAPADVPAWCGLTGHRLVAMHPPAYYIERKRQ